MASDSGRADAAASLDQLGAVRGAIATRVAAPWWYRLGAALCTAALFVGIGLFPVEAGESDSLAFVVIVLGAIVGPTLLATALKRTTGVVVDRYAQGMFLWYLVVFGLLAVGLVAQLWLEVPWALYAAAPVGLVATLLLERHIDRLLVRRVTAAGGQG